MSSAFRGIWLVAELRFLTLACQRRLSLRESSEPLPSHFATAPDESRRDHSTRIAAVDVYCEGTRATFAERKATMPGQRHHYPPSFRCFHQTESRGVFSKDGLLGCFCRPCSTYSHAIFTLPFGEGRRRGTSLRGGRMEARSVFRPPRGAKKLKRTFCSSFTWF